MGKTHSGLTDMQTAFVANYLVTLNAKRAAIAAGYSEKTAEEQGYQLLRNPSVSKALRRAMARRAKRLELTADNVLREIARIAFSDIRAICTFDELRGVTFKSSDVIHSDAAAAIQSVQTDVSTKSGGRYTDESIITTTTKVKLHDKMKALDLAGRHLGLWDLPDAGNEERKPLILNYGPKTGGNGK